MAPRAVDIHPLALREVRAAYRWYAQRTPAAAQRFRLAVERMVQRIATAPEQGSPYRQRYRWMKLQRFPYLFFYDIGRDPQPVLIYAVAHAGRRPGYWLRRTWP
jgi:plasmid stabilization system protein ParE